MAAAFDYVKKFCSFSLTFNSLLTVVSVLGVLEGFYSARYSWKPYPPYLIDGSFFWFAVLAAMFNIYFAVRIGRVKTGRLWFLVIEIFKRKKSQTTNLSIPDYSL